MKMVSNIGVPGLILIVALALIIFGPKKLPKIGRTVGQSLKEFKKSTKGLISDEKEYAIDIEKLIFDKK